MPGVRSKSFGKNTGKANANKQCSGKSVNDRDGDDSAKADGYDRNSDRRVTHKVSSVCQLDGCCLVMCGRRLAM
jgi:hypothetical protein